MANIKNTVALALLACCTPVSAMEETSSEFFNKPPLVEQETQRWPSPKAVSPNIDCMAITSSSDPVFRECFPTVQLVSPQAGSFGVATLEHSKPVASVAFSPCGKKLATASYDDVVHLWDLKSGRHIAKRQVPHVFMDNTLAFSPNSSYLAFTRTAVGASVWKIEPPNEPIKHYTDKRTNTWGLFTSESTLIYARLSEDSSIGFIDIATKKQSIKMLRQSCFVQYLAQASRELHIVAAVTVGGKVWCGDTREDPPMSPFPHLRGVTCAALSPCAHYLLVAADGHLPSLQFLKLDFTTRTTTPMLQWLLNVSSLPTHLHWAADNSSILCAYSDTDYIKLYALTKKFQDELALLGLEEERHEATKSVNS